MKARPSRRQTSPRVAPQGIPPLFLLDALRRDRSARSARDTAVHARLREYFDAKGTLIGSSLPRALQLSALQVQGRRHRFPLFTLMRTDPGDEL